MTTAGPPDTDAAIARRPLFMSILGRIHPLPLAAVVLWGGVFPGSKLALAEMPFLAVLSLRLLVAAAALLVVVGGPRRCLPPRPLWRAAANAGAAQAVFQLLLVGGLAGTSASTSAILIATAPLFAAVWAATFGRQLPGGRGLLGLVLGFAGVVLVMAAGAGAGGGTALGNLAALGAGATWAWYGLAAAPLVAGMGPLRATAWSIAVAALTALPLGLPSLVTLDWGDVSWPAWAGLVYAATLGMVVAMALWNLAIGRIGIARTIPYAYLEPVSGVLLAALLLAEPLTLVQLAGAAATLLGVWLAS